MSAASDSQQANPNKKKKCKSKPNGCKKHKQNKQNKKNKQSQSAPQQQPPPMAPQEQQPPPAPQRTLSALSQP